MSSIGESLHPYVVFLPSDQKVKILGSIFGSNVAVGILRLALKQGISKKLYQKDVIASLEYSNKTVIESLRALTKLAILSENMEKQKQGGRTVWVKSYQLSDAGKWFALLLAEEKELSQAEKASILESLFRAYISWVKTMFEKLKIDRMEIQRIFAEEMRGKG